MSAWRKEATKRLPEFQRLITSRDVDNPMMLWIELHLKFDRLCAQDPPPLELLRRVWGYAKWCLKNGHPDVQTAAAIGFCEQLLYSEASRRLIPEIMGRHDYEGLRSLLLYHNTEDQYEQGLKRFEAKERK